MSNTKSLKAESVSKNPFFQILRQTYNELYSLAAKRGWKICVPHSTTISGATLNEHFFKSHILQSSPYFKEEYVTLNGQCVIYKNGIISTKTGFESPRKVYVLGEELFYTQDFKSFTVYSISCPLIGIYQNNHNHHNNNNHHNHNVNTTTKIIKQQQESPRQITKTNHNYSSDNNNNDINNNNNNNNNNRTNNTNKFFQIPIENRNEKHWKQLLSLSLDPITYKKMMEEIKNFSDQFNRSYVMIKGYTKSASKRIEEFRNNTFDIIINGDNNNNHNKNKNKNNKINNNHKNKNKNKNKKLYKFNKNELDELQSSFDSYLNFILFDRIFTTFLLRHFKNEDNLFCEKLKYLQLLSQETIGIKKQFQCFDTSPPFKYAINKLSEINNYKTPILKLSVLKDTFRLIRQQIENNRKQDEEHKKMNEEEMALTTDDMLSLFTFVLIHSNIKYILTNNEYIKYFYFQLHCTAHLDYFVATFQATILYIKNQLFIPKYFKNYNKNKQIHNNNNNNNNNNNLNINNRNFPF